MMTDIQTKNIKDFKTRDEFNAYKQQMESFLNKHNLNYQYVKNPHGVVVTKKEMNEIERTLKRVNRIREEEVKRRRKMPFKHGKKPTEFNVGEQEKLMGDTRFRESKHKVKNNFHNMKNYSDYEEWKKEVEEEFGGNYRDKRSQGYKDRYIKGLENIFGDESKQLIKHIEKMPLGDFMDVYYSNTIGNISYIYLPADRSAKLKNIGEGFGVK